MDMKIFQCNECGNQWEIAYGTPRPGECPKCGNTNIHRAEEDRGNSRRRGGGRGRGKGQGRRHGQVRSRKKDSGK